jgi:hypothetical protein
MPQLKEAVQGEGGPKIGPVATDLLFENDDVKIWQMDRGPGETFWHHYHNYDYIFFQITDLFGANDGEEEHQRVWEARSQSAQGASGKASRSGTLLPAQCVLYIPGTGWLSPGFINLGSNRALAALVELKRPRPAGQSAPGYSRSDALAGIGPRPGSVHMLENDRVRVYETTLEPGQSDEMRAQLDAAVYVIEGGKIRVIEEREEGGRGDSEQEHPDVSGRFLPGGVRRQFVNVGSTRYRHLSVELK